MRASVEALDALLDPEFREIGASGRLWTREAVVQALTGDANTTDAADTADTRIRDEERSSRYESRPAARGLGRT